MWWGGKSWLVRVGILIGSDGYAMAFPLVGKADISRQFIRGPTGYKGTGQNTPPCYDAAGAESRGSDLSPLAIRRLGAFSQTFVP